MPPTGPDCFVLATMQTCLHIGWPHIVVACLSPLRACPRCVPVPVVCLSPLCACPRCVPVPVVWMAPLCGWPRCVDGPTLLAFRSPPFSCGATHLSVTHLSVTVPPTGSDCFVLATRFRRRCQPLRVSLEPVISAETGIQGACNACPRCVLVAWDSRAIHRPAFILPPG